MRLQTEAMELLRQQIGEPASLQEARARVVELVARMAEENT
jgi:hypothetical protein